MITGTVESHLVCTLPSKHTSSLPIKTLLNATPKPFTVSKDRCRSCVLSYESCIGEISIVVTYSSLNFIWISMNRYNTIFQACDDGVQEAAYNGQYAYVSTVIPRLTSDPANEYGF